MGRRRDRAETILSETQGPDADETARRRVAAVRRLLERAAELAESDRPAANDEIEVALLVLEGPLYGGGPTDHAKAILAETRVPGDTYLVETTLRRLTAVQQVLERAAELPERERKDALRVAVFVLRETYCVPDEPLGPAR